MSKTNEEIDEVIEDTETDAPEEEADEVESEDTEIDVDLDEDEESGEEEDEDAEAADEGAESDEDEGADEGDEGSEKNRSAIAQKKKWRERALKAEAKLKDKKPEASPAKKAAANGSNNATINFRLDHPSLKTNEVEEIEAYAKMKGVSLEKALNSDVIRTMLALNKRKRMQAGSSISPSHRSQPTKPEKDWSRAGREEMEAEAARRVAASRKAKR